MYPNRLLLRWFTETASWFMSSLAVSFVKPASSLSDRNFSADCRVHFVYEDGRLEIESIRHTHVCAHLNSAGSCADTFRWSTVIPSILVGCGRQCLTDGTLTIVSHRRANSSSTCAGCPCRDGPSQRRTMLQSSSLSFQSQQYELIRTSKQSTVNHRRMETSANFRGENILFKYILPLLSFRWCHPSAPGSCQGQ